MSEPRVYVHPAEPGAPQPGDLVVIVHTCPPRRADPIPVRHSEGDMAVLAWISVTPPLDDWRWGMGHIDTCWVHAVRWPTPAELAAYQLGSQALP